MHEKLTSIFFSLFQLFKLMDVDGDRSFSSGDLENIGNADDVSTNHRKRTNQLGD